jgi:hypothetical protein
MSGSLMTMTVYGANADYLASETPDSSQSYFQNLSGLTATTLNVYDGGFTPVLESEETVYADDRTYVTKTITGSYKVRVKHRIYPNTDTSIAAYVPELGVLKMAYNWIRIEGYKIGFETTHIVRAINLIAWSETKFHEWTSYEFEFKFRKPL